jgi:branched-chain amino acid transport system ATP-binding protein
MLTMRRTLVGDPDLVIIDEPTEGLAPKLVEQKLTIALKISHRLYVMGHGRIVFAGTSASWRPMRRFERSGWRFDGSQAVLFDLS